MDCPADGVAQCVLGVYAWFLAKSSSICQAYRDGFCDGFLVDFWLIFCRFGLILDGFWVILGSFGVHFGLMKGFRKHSKQELRKMALWGPSVSLQNDVFGPFWAPGEGPKSLKFTKMGSQKSLFFWMAFRKLFLYHFGGGKFQKSRVLWNYNIFILKIQCSEISDLLD